MTIQHRSPESFGEQFAQAYSDQLELAKYNQARLKYMGLLNSMYWDFQNEERTRTFILYCEELYGSERGEDMARSVMRLGANA